jgi:hypothetical protein
MAQIPEILNLPPVAEYDSVRRELVRAWTQMAQTLNAICKLYYQNDEPVIPDNSIALWVDADGGPKYYLVANLGGTIKKVEVL